MVGKDPLRRSRPHPRAVGSGGPPHRLPVATRLPSRGLQPAPPAAAPTAPPLPMVPTATPTAWSRRAGSSNRSTALWVRTDACIGAPRPSSQRSSTHPTTASTAAAAPTPMAATAPSRHAPLARRPQAPRSCGRVRSVLCSGRARQRLAHLIGRRRRRRAPSRAGLPSTPTRTSRRRYLRPDRPAHTRHGYVL